MKLANSIESFGISDIGHVRSNNEDVWTQNLHIPFFILADGMGGHNAGEVAAKVAVIHLTQRIDDFFFAQKQPPSVDTVAAFLRDAVKKTNALVHELSEENPELNGMGTTLCCLILHQDSAIYAHVGDSRVYRFKESLEQLTTDHSLRSELLAKGELTPQTASKFPRKNVITRAIGTSRDVIPDVGISLLRPGETYLLCSDGLTDCVQDAEIATLLSLAPSVEEGAQILVDTAKAHGGTDNITLVMIKSLG